MISSTSNEPTLAISWTISTAIERSAASTIASGMPMRLPVTGIIKSPNGMNATTLPAILSQTAFVPSTSA